MDIMLEVVQLDHICLKETLGLVDWVEVETRPHDQDYP